MAAKRASTIGSLLGAAGLAFGVYTYWERQVEQRATDRTTIGNHGQLIDDLRARVKELEEQGRFVHGEFTLPGSTLR